MISYEEISQRRSIPTGVRQWTSWMMDSKIFHTRIHTQTKKGETADAVTP